MQVVVVLAVAGGAGSSTLASLLARRRAADGGRVVLVDLDPARGGLEVLLGLEERPGVRWPDLRLARGTVAPEDLLGTLPRWEGVEVLSADRRTPPRLDDAMLRAVWPALVEGCTTVVVDASARGTTGAGPVVQEPSDDGWWSRVLDGAATVLVTGQDVLGVAGAIAARDALPVQPAGVVVRRRRAARVAPFEVAEVLDLPLLAVLPADRAVAGSTDRGLGPRPRRHGGLDRQVARLDRALPAGRPALRRGPARGGTPRG